VNERLTILCGDALDKLREMADQSVHCCVTSPPYWGLRDYKVTPTGWPEMIYKPMPGLPPITIPPMVCCLGAEPTPEAFTGHLVIVFREVRRVLRDDGTFWLNLGDSYFGSWGNYSGQNRGHGSQREITNGSQVEARAYDGLEKMRPPTAGKHTDMKPKDLCMIPNRVALALQADGWYLRCDIIWAKRNCMPESVTDRPTRSHEFLFLLTKSERYFYDAEAIKEPCIYDVDGTGTAARKARVAGNKLLPTGERNGIRPAGYKNSVNFDGKNKGNEKQRGHSRRHAGFNDRWDAMEKEEQCTGMRNKRDVWTVAPANYPDAHFATYPPKLIEPCILAGTSAKGCCPACGAPWERVVERQPNPSKGTNTGPDLTGGAPNMGGNRQTSAGLHRNGGNVEGPPAKTIGWQPTCNCPSTINRSRPSTVLDPFGGSGTTAEVALSHGRRAIVIELNPHTSH